MVKAFIAPFETPADLEPPRLAMSDAIADLKDYAGVIAKRSSVWISILVCGNKAFTAVAILQLVNAFGTGDIFGPHFDQKRLELKEHEDSQQAVTRPPRT